MSATPLDLLIVAKTLSSQSADEPTNRSVINRAYYAAYHAAKRFHSRLPSPGSIGNASGSHEQLIASLDNPTIKRDADYWLSKALSKTLRLTMNARIDADYHLDLGISQQISQTTVGQSSEILRRTGDMP
jgi:hypothetical protein